MCIFWDSSETWQMSEKVWKSKGVINKHICFNKRTMGMFLDSNETWQMSEKVW